MFVSIKTHGVIIHDFLSFMIVLFFCFVWYMAAFHACQMRCCNRIACRVFRDFTESSMYTTCFRLSGSGSVLNALFLWHQDFYFQQEDENSDDDGLFYEVECHTLIGVATIWLECLFESVPLDYAAPIISQQGEVCWFMTIFNFKILWYMVLEHIRNLIHFFNTVFCLLLLSHQC